MCPGVHLQTCSIQPLISSSNTGHQQSRASQPDIVDVVQQAHQNKTTFQSSPSFFQRIAGSLPPWNKRGWKCWPGTLWVHGYLSCRPCLWRETNAGVCTRSPTNAHSCADRTIHECLLWITETGLEKCKYNHLSGHFSSNRVFARPFSRHRLSLWRKRCMTGI